MPKLLHLVIWTCEQCPHLEELKPGDARCAAPNRFVKVSPKMMCPTCPLPDYQVRI